MSEKASSAPAQSLFLPWSGTKSLPEKTCYFFRVTKRFSSHFFLLTYTLIYIFVGSMGFGQTQAIEIPDHLEHAIINDPDSAFAIALVMKDQVDMGLFEKEIAKEGVSPDQKVAYLIQRLQAQAVQSQREILTYVDTLSGIEKGTVRSLWLNNTIFVHAQKIAIDALIMHPAVGYILPDLHIMPDAHHDESDLTFSAVSIESGLKAINAPDLWAMGYTGYAQKALIIDTGIDGMHPALADRYVGNFAPEEQAWFDGNLGTASPNYCDGHGTHVAGTVLGLDPFGEDTIGVAFGALWMGAPAICDGLSSDNLAAMQWALDPDGDPMTIEDMPDVINNSWRATDIGNECLDQLYGPAFDVLETAGVAIVFSAGNGGPDTATITAPKNINHSLVNTFTVAAINAVSTDLNLLAFSSRGPSSCPDTGSLAIKPEVAAPGFQVRSAIPGGGYGRKSGTSMAAPHVSGAILLLKEAFPFLTGTTLKEALYFSALDLGDSGEDNEYGMGLIDVYAAFQYLVNQGHVPVPVNDDYDPAIIQIDGIPLVSCDSFYQAEIQLANRGAKTLTALDIAYVYSNGIGGVVNWMGQLMSDSLISVQLPWVSVPAGAHSVEVSISQVNGGESDYHYLDNKKRQYFWSFPDALTTYSPVVVCEGNEALLSGEVEGEGNIKWFDSPMADTPLSIAQPWVLPQPLDTISYFAGLFYEQSVGHRDNNTGSGGYVSSTEGRLIFDCITPFTLKSALVHSQSDGYRTIELWDDQDILIHSETVFLNIGSHRLDLNIEITTGKNWQLGLADQGNLYRHFSGATYPYQVPGIMEITRSSQGKDSYFFFYDWILEYESPCGRQEIEVQPSSGEMMAEFDVDTMNSQLGLGIFQFVDQSMNAMEWYWDFGDGQVSTEQYPLHSYLDTGIYQVALFASGQDGCGDTYVTSIRVDTVLATTLQDEREHRDVLVFPNPSAGIFTALLDRHQNHHSTLSVFDAIGQRVFHQKNPADVIRTDIDLRNHLDGLYFLKVVSDGQTFVRRLLKSSP